jgi:hypothetical protein
MREKRPYDVAAAGIQSCIVQRGEADLVAEIGIGTAVEKQGGEVAVAARGRDDQRGFAIITASIVHIGTRAQQQTPGLYLSLLRRKQQRREPTRRTRPCISAMVEQQRDDVGGFIRRRPHQRSLTTSCFARIHIRASVEQQLRHVGVAIVDGCHQRRLARQQLRVWIGARVQQEFRHLDVAACRRDPECRCTIFVGGVDVRVCADQTSGTIDVVPIDRQHQRSRAVGLGIRIGRHDDRQQQGDEAGREPPHKATRPVLSPKRSTVTPRRSSSVRYRFAIGVSSA